MTWFAALLSGFVYFILIISFLNTMKQADHHAISKGHAVLLGMGYGAAITFTWILSVT